jgi:nicotinamidase-related amidase
MAQLTAIRNPERDFLLTPENSVFIFIDYQPEQFHGVTSKSKEDLMLNLMALAKTAHDYSVPVVLTTVGVTMGVNQGTVAELKEIFPNEEEIDRTSLNAWEDEDFLLAVKRTGRRKIVMAGLWTEVCVAFPAINALEDGFEVYPVLDAIGGVTKESHETAVQRMVQYGAQPITALALACELQRDWARGQGKTLRGIVQWYFRELSQRRQREPGFQREGSTETGHMHS